MLQFLMAVQPPPDPSKVGPGTAAFVTFVFLVIACVFLFRSLNKQLKRVDFVEEPEAEPDTSSATAPR